MLVSLYNELMRRALTPSGAIAHSRADDKFHDLLAHLIDTSNAAGRFADVFGAMEAASLCGRWHDLGKHSRDFMKRVLGASISVDHCTAGTVHAIRELGIWGYVVAYGIDGHHRGLSDWIDIEARVAGGEGLLIEAKRGKPSPEILLTELSGDDLVRPDIDRLTGLSTYIRMVFSCLVDSDYLDTEKFFCPFKEGLRSKWRNIDDLRDSLESRLQRFASAPDTHVNRLRNKVLSECISSATRPPGLFSLTAPTGLGKTLASLAFAMEHAKCHGLRRVIYALPFMSVTEQVSEVFREAFGSGAVLEHHSGPSRSAEKKSYTSKLAAENWDAPIVVTTTVQLFESLFHRRPSRVRKLHNIAGSVLVLDEAQLLPHPALKPILASIQELALNYDVSVVLCTATQPSFHQVIGDFVPSEIARNPSRMFSRMRRVSVDWHSAPVRWEDVANELCAERQALVILNTRSNCRDLHSLLPDHAIYLSTFLCPAHRSEIVFGIRESISAGHPVLVTSTQLIEAGVDLDFPVVFRERAGLVSLAQAAGRCNREGLLKAGRLVVFRPLHTVTLPKPIRQEIAACESVWPSCSSNPFMPDSFKRYFGQLYRDKGGGSLDERNVLKPLRMKDFKRNGSPARYPGHPCHIDFKTGTERFRMFDEWQESVFVPFDSVAKAAIGELYRTGVSRESLRRLQPYAVPVPRKRVAELKDSGRIESVEGVCVLSSMDSYSSRFGLAELARSTDKKGD